MKKVEKIVVIHRGEGCESLKNIFWEWFGSDILIKPVNYLTLSDEFGFGKHADIVVCQESVNNHAKVILSQWPYPVQIICLGKPKKTEGAIDYVPTIHMWDNRDYIKIHKKRRG